MDAATTAQLAALKQAGLQSLSAGDAAGAMRQLAQAASLEPGNAPLLNNLGLACRAAGRLDEARDAFGKAIALDAGFFIARLYLGATLEDLGLGPLALTQYFAAVTRAQAQGRWLGPDTTAPALRALVAHAMRAIDTGRGAYLAETLEPLRQKYGEVELKRVIECLRLYLGVVPTQYADARQQPKFLYFPDLPPTTFFDRALFPWYAQLEKHFDAVREEMRAVLHDPQGIEPFIRFERPEQAKGYLDGDGTHAPNWDAFFFYRHGERYAANCARCPRTAEILDALPLARIREHAPEICFSVLTPGTHIMLHRGVTNTRLVTHFPLQVPEGDCAIVVGGERHEWREGECFSFDDTFEHEAWNRSPEVRVVMLMDCWNPYLTAIEREALEHLIARIGDFNREAGIAQG